MMWLTVFEFFTVFSSLILTLPLMLSLLIIALVLNILIRPVAILTVAVTSPVLIVGSLRLIMWMIIGLTSAVSMSWSAVISMLMRHWTSLHMPVAVLRMVTVIRNYLTAGKVLLLRPDLLHVLIVVIVCLLQRHVVASAKSLTALIVVRTSFATLIFLILPLLVLIMTLIALRVGVTGHLRMCRLRLLLMVSHLLKLEFQLSGVLGFWGFVK